MFTPPLDPAVYPHLNIYPAITSSSRPAHPTPVPSVPNSMKATDIQRALGYPSLVICESRVVNMDPSSHDFAADPSVYPWIDVYPSVPGEVSRPLSPVSFRQLRARAAIHTRAKLRKRFTADQDAPPVPKLPDYATLRALSYTPPSSPRRDRKLPIQRHIAYPVMSICD